MIIGPINIDNWINVYLEADHVAPAGNQCYAVYASPEDARSQRRRLLRLGVTSTTITLAELRRASIG